MTARGIPGAPVSAILSPEEQAWMQEEYRALRAEIIGNADYQSKLIVFGSVAIATALGFVFGSKNDAPDPNAYMLVFLAEILAISFWFIWERISLVTETLGNYIFLRLERHTALNWETFQRVLLRRACCEAAHETKGLVSPDAPVRSAAVDDIEEASAKKSLGSRLLNLGMLLPFVGFATFCSACIVFSLLAHSTAPSLLRWMSGILLVAIIGYSGYIEIFAKSTRRLVHDTDGRLVGTRAYRERQHWPIDSTQSRARSGSRLKDQ
jgi:hypothetical protein